MIQLPWPPSVNRYWRNIKGRTLVSKEARDYKALVKILALTWKRPCLTGRLSVSIQAYPPDRRRRDLDNIFKAIADSLQDAGLFVDDSQIDRLMIERMDVKKDGVLLITISEIKEDESAKQEGNPS